MNEKELASIKKPGQTDQVTKEEFEKRIREIAKSKRDICYWAETYFRIVSLNTGLTTISLYQKQRELLQALVNNDRSIVLASRQVGKCVFKDTIIIVLNKKTSIIQRISIEDFFKRIAQQNAQNLQEAEMHSFASTERKFIQSFSVEDYKILADDGWQECKAIHKTIQYQIWELQTTHLCLKCADNHIVFDENMNEIFIKDLHDKVCAGAGRNAFCGQCLHNRADLLIMRVSKPAIVPGSFPGGKWSKSLWKNVYF